MYIYKATPIGSMVNIRTDHTTASADIGDLLNGQFAEGDQLWENAEKTQKWLNIQAVNGQPKAGWVAVVYNGSLLCTLETNVPPPAGTSIELTIEQIVDGVKYIPEGGNPVKLVKV